jgi:Protein of unknown function (DUF2927)
MLVDENKFEITEEEYDDLVQYLIALPSPRPYRTLRGCTMKKFMFLYFVLLFILSGCVNKPDIQITGVEEGKVYAYEPTITINEEQGWTYSMTLNGESIKSGHIVEKNGTYNLSINGKKLWLKSKKDITFKIDDQPPYLPTLKEEVQPGYFQEAKFELIEEDGVTYDIKLNREPYDLSEPIQKEGMYELDIVAFKENGLVTQRTDSFIIDNQTFTKEMVDAFLSFHFANEQIEDPFIIKWISEKVPVYIHGKPTNEDLDQLSRYLNELNAGLPVQFEIYQENKYNYTNYQLDIYFVPNEQFKDYGYTEELIQEYGETIGFALATDANDVDGLLTTTIGIDSTVNQNDRNPTILHELVHALGMYNHFENDTSSILYPVNNQQITTLNDTDQTLLDMLYRADIIPGMTESEIRQMWKPRIVE